MSVLTCPVCQGAMREMNREGILIDVCTQCRGVWLDRGELEKLAAYMPQGPAPMPMASRPMPQQQPYPPQRPYPDEDAYRSRERRRDWDDDDDDRHDDDRRYRGDDRGGGEYRGEQRRSGVGRFLDFFD